MTTQKKLISEAHIKKVIREEFASQGVILTEEQLEELFGLFGKSKLIKQIKAADADGSELDKLGYDANNLKGLSKVALKQILGDLRDVTGIKEPKGFVQKVKDVYAGVKDIGILGGGAGTLLGGEETFDIEKRKALKGTAEKQLQGWLKKLKYPPATSLYASLRKQGFPNNDENDFMANTAEIYNEYDKVVKDYKAKQIECDAANTIIAVLRALVIYFQDFGMADKYFYVNEQEEPEQEEKMGAAQGSVSKNFVAAYGNKLPLGLAAAGLGALAAGFTADSEFFQNFLQGFTDMENIPTAEDVTRNVSSTLQLGDVQGGEGIIKVVRRLTDMKDFGTPGGPGLGQLADPKYKMVLGLVRASMIAKEGPRALMQAIQQNANPTQLFVAGPSSGTAKVGEELFGLNKGSFEQNITKVISDKVKGIASAPADTIKNKFLGVLGTFLGPVLKALGLGALVAALASFTMRQKGKGKMGGSRMSRLKGIVDEMVDIPCDEKEDEECPEGQTRNPETGECEEDTGPEDPCKDKPGTRWNPEKEECECPDDLTWNPETKECEEIKPPPPQPPPTKRLGLLRLDDDGVKVYIGTRRSKDQRGYERDVMSKAQDNAITGRNTDPTTDDLNDRPGGFRMDKRYSKSAEDSEWKDLMKAVKGSSRKDPEPYVTVDASVYNDSARALRKAGVKARANSRAFKTALQGTVKSLLVQYINNKKKLSSKDATSDLRPRFDKAGIELTDEATAALIGTLQDYGLVQPGEQLQESITINRWKVLSGIK